MCSPGSPSGCGRRGCRLRTSTATVVPISRVLNQMVTPSRSCCDSRAAVSPRRRARRSSRRASPFQAAVADFNDDGRPTWRSPASRRRTFGSCCDSPAAGSRRRRNRRSRGAQPTRHRRTRPQRRRAAGPRRRQFGLRHGEHPAAPAGGGFAEEAGSPVPAGDTPYGVVSRTSTATAGRTWPSPTRTPTRLRCCLEARVAASFKV